MTPRTHKRADFRVIARILVLSHGIASPSDLLLSKITDIYKGNGGKWSSFFKGEPDQVKLLKTVIKKVVKNEQNRD